MSNKIRIDSLSSGDYLKCTDNGPGFRIVVWFSGCSHNCPNCHNKTEQNPNAGTPFTESDIDFILAELEKPQYSGLSILGGEPMELYNVEAVLNLCKRVKEKFPYKNIWIWSGSTIAQLRNLKNSYVDSILSVADYLVDGPFIEDKKNLNLKFRGSSNQHIINLRTNEFEDD